MAQRAKTYFNWSSGKDSALALHYLLEQKNVHIDLLLTTVNAHFNRVSMHGLRREVLIAQARSLEIALEIVDIPENPSMDRYNSIITDKIRSLRSRHYSHTAFGDIFLADIRSYRENMLRPFGIKAIFPLWHKPSHALMESFFTLGYRAVIICIDNSKLDKSFLGCELSRALIRSLPENVDPCGENGEFHTFCFDGPIFKKPIAFDLGEHVFRTYKNPSTTPGQKVEFGFCDVLLSR